MDPLTHALIGANIAGLFGHPASSADPFFWGTTLAAVIPDLDIVMQVKGDLAYLRSHRGFSHSLPFLLSASGIITIIIYLAFGKAVSIPALFAATAAGALSHSFFDMLNSYGVRTLWPFVKNKIALSTVSLVDWLIIAISAASIAAGRSYPETFDMWAAVLLIYLLCRARAHLHVRSYLKTAFSEYSPQKIVILPNRFGILKWDFLLETDSLFIVGQVNSLSFVTEIKRKFKKNTSNNPFIKAALESKLGKLFMEFTPHFHVIHRKDEHRHIVDFIDLRYFGGQDFIHTGVVSLDEKCRAIEQIFQPYSKRRRIQIV